MAEQSSQQQNTTWEEIEEYLRTDEDCRQLFGQQNLIPSNVNESIASTVTTPDPLNMAFINDETDINEPQSQTTIEASSTIRGLVSTIIEKQEEEEERKHEIIHLHPPTLTTSTIPPSTPAKKSTGTMPKTPSMKSTGTMPRTPIMVSTGTMPRTPMMRSTGTIPRTPTMVSTGTMPRTPMMKSTGTMPRTPIMASTGTMPKTPTTIDLVSPTIEIIDLCSSGTPTDGGSPNSPPSSLAAAAAPPPPQ